MRRLHLVVAILALTAQVAFAQRPSIPMPRPLPMPSGHSTPAPGARVRSTLVFRDGRVPPNVMLLRRVNRSFGVFALPFFWNWGAPAFYIDTPVPLLAAGDVPTHSSRTRTARGTARKRRGMWASTLAAALLHAASRRADTAGGRPRRLRFTATSGALPLPPHACLPHGFEGPSERRFIPR